MAWYGHSHPPPPCDPRHSPSIAFPLTLLLTVQLVQVVCNPALIWTVHWHGLAVISNVHIIRLAGHLSIGSKL